MPDIPNLVERTYMLRLNRGPGPMLDLFNGMGLEAAMLGLDLGVFEGLDEEPASATALAARLDVDETGVHTLLRFLARAGYVTESGGRYSLTPMSERWLLESSTESYARYFRFWQEVLYPFWREHAREAIREGVPPRSVYEWLDERPERWETAQAAFELTAELIGDDIAATLDIPADAAVLDVGGGHGLYSIAICDRHPTATATIFDEEPVRDLAKGHVSAAGLADRISFEVGDYERDSFGSGYDVSLVFNVVHGNDRETNERLFEKLADAVKPDGQVAILDQFGDESRASISNTGTRFLDLTYLVSLGGRTYHTETVGTWLREAGFSLAERQSYPDRNMTLLVATRE